jgi:hypothetical protein
MTYVITSNGLICQFDEHRQMRGERDLQVRKEKRICFETKKTYYFFFIILGKNQLFSYW